MQLQLHKHDVPTAVLGPILLALQSYILSCFVTHFVTLLIDIWVFAIRHKRPEVLLDVIAMVPFLGMIIQPLSSRRLLWQSKKS